MISVCIATYNGERFIKKQLDSILSQISKNDEIIISDDNSSDSTIEIIQSYKDSRIKLFHHNKELSLLKEKSASFKLVAQNFENALKKAKGDYVFLADQDDIWKENKVAEIIRYLQTYDIVMSNFSIIDENDMITKKNFYETSPISKYLLINIIRSHFLGCCMAFKKSVLEYCLPFPKNLICHDYWLGCIGTHKFNFYFIPNSLHLYRRTSDNVSTSTGKSKNSIMYRIKYRFDFLLSVLFHLVRK